jgi:pyruvate dehydrogenase E2 component (dihydrolipoamide acetyltransferase)
MATPVIMPRQGNTVESCIITKFYKKPGDKVQVGDLLFTYETDKATFDEEAKVEGTVLAIFFEEGDDIPVLTNVCVIGNEGESVAEFDPRANAKVDKMSDESSVSVQCENEPKPSEETSEAPAVPINEGERVKISPRARNLAERIGVDYRYASASGPYGRIIEKDIIELQQKGMVFTPAAMENHIKSDLGTVLGTGLGGRITTDDLKGKPVDAESALLERQATEPEFVEVKLTNIRKVIAKAMHHSITSTCQLTLNTSFDATEILAYRKRLKVSKEQLGLENITINDMILFAVSRTILNHKDLNAHFLEDKMLVFNNVNLGVAVDTERGLMVPTLFHANKKSLNEISRETKGLIEQCQKGTISPDLLKGGTFTITNLGTLDIESFTPVLNPPQTGILGVNTIVQRAREVNGEMVYYPAMGLSLTFDHRALDGAPAARFLKELKTNLENFSTLLSK